MVFLLISLFIVTTTAANGPDFRVYWSSVAAMLRGERLYSVARDGIMVFKYPVWIAPLFAPFALLEWDWARRFWGLLEAACFLLVTLDLRKNSRLAPAQFSFILLLFYGLLSVHAFNGQVSLIFLAVAWFGLRSQSPWNESGSAFILSAKIFTLFPMLGWLQRAERPLLPRALALAFRTAALAIPLSVVPFMLTSEPGSQLLHQWTEAMGPGRDPQTHAVIIGMQGIEAQGLGSAIVRLFSIPPDLAWATTSLSLVIFASVGAYWWRRSRRLELQAAWAGWIALTAVVQPLAGFHSFVLVLPLAIVCWEMALQTGRSGFKGAALIGLLFVTALTQKTLGASIGTAFQLISIKSIGVLVLTETLVRARATLPSVRIVGSQNL